MKTALESLLIMKVRMFMLKNKYVWMSWNLFILTFIYYLQKKNWCDICSSNNFYLFDENSATWCIEYL